MSAKRKADSQVPAEESDQLIIRPLLVLIIDDGKLFKMGLYKKYTLINMVLM